MPYENLLLNRKAVICKSVQRFPPRNAKGGKISPAASARWGYRSGKP